MAGYVYLIGSHIYSWYKIGKSNIPQIRIRTIGVLLPFKIEVVAVWRAEDSRQLEALLHRKYFENNINGEWFSFNKMEIQALILDVPYTLVQVNSLTNFTNMAEDFKRTVIQPKMTIEEKEWRKQHGAAWQEIQKIQDKEKRKQEAQKLITDRKMHRLLLIQKRRSR
jgi:hypothetical protein